MVCWWSAQLSRDHSGDETTQERQRSEQTGRTLASAIVDTIAKVVVIGAPVSYALGRAYAEGYWREIGITPTIMARGFEDYVYFSFVMVVNVAVALFSLGDLVALLIAVGALLLLFIAVVLAGLSVPRFFTWLKFKTRVARRRASRWLRRRKAVGRAVVQGQATVGTIAVFITVGSYLLLLLLLPVAIAQKVGSRQAEITRTRISEDDYRYERVAARSGESRIEGRMLECNARWCVIYSDSDFIAVPESSVEWLVDSKDVAAPTSVSE